MESTEDWWKEHFSALRNRWYYIYFQCLRALKEESVAFLRQTRKGRWFGRGTGYHCWWRIGGGGYGSDKGVGGVVVVRKTCRRESTSSWNGSGLLMLSNPWVLVRSSVMEVEVRYISTGKFIREREADAGEYSIQICSSIDRWCLWWKLSWILQELVDVMDEAHTSHWRVMEIYTWRHWRWQTLEWSRWTHAGEDTGVKFTKEVGRAVTVWDFFLPRWSSNKYRTTPPQKTIKNKYISNDKALDCDQNGYNFDHFLRVRVKIWCGRTWALNDFWSRMIAACKLTWKCIIIK